MTALTVSISAAASISQSPPRMASNADQDPPPPEAVPPRAPVADQDRSDSPPSGPAPPACRFAHDLYGAFPVKRLFWVVLTVFCSERERPFFVPSPAIRSPER